MNPSTSDIKQDIQEFEYSRAKKTLWIVEFIYKLIKEGYTGNVQLNFYSGGITNVTQTQSFKPPKE